MAGDAEIEVLSTAMPHLSSHFRIWSNKLGEIAFIAIIVAFPPEL